MRKAEQIISILWIGLAISVCVGSLRLELGTFHDPGPGFLPFGAGALLGLLAIAHLINVSFRFSEGEEKGLPWIDVHWQKGIYVIIALLAYAYLLPKVGYLIDTFFLMLFLFGVMGRKRWWAVFIGTLFVIGITYLIFAVWLMVQFPKGFLGIG